MQITVINPNTTESMTRMIEVSARAGVSPGTHLSAITNRSGPASIESHYDEALSVPGMLSIVRESEPADAYVVACFGDPGLDAVREIAPGPVVGIAEAAVRTAGYLGRWFSVVTTMARTVGRAEDLIDRYGAREYCRSVRACEVAVLDLETDVKAQEKILDECHLALSQDGAEVIVLGCAGMGTFGAELAAELGVPVIDAVTVAAATAEGLVRAGLSTSRRGEYATPPPKEYLGNLSGFAIKTPSS